MQESRFLFLETWETCLISSGVSAETSHPDSPCRQFWTLESRGAAPVFAWDALDAALDWGAATPAASSPSSTNIRVRAGIPFQFPSIFVFCHEDRWYWYS